MKTSFQLVSEMNEAFGNPKGDPTNIDWDRVRSQFKNIGDEYAELLEALGAPSSQVASLRSLNSKIEFLHDPDLEGVRDASRDVVVFADGGHHLMGIDGDRDMQAVIDGVMTRFIKDDVDQYATVAMHEAKGVIAWTVEGVFPTKIMRSAADQPDAPKGKFLKSASYKQTEFYKVS